MMKKEHNNDESISETTNDDENKSLNQPEEILESLEKVEAGSEQKDEESTLLEQIELLQDKLLRSMAETENVRTRLNKNVEEARDYSIINFAKDLIPVMDNFKRALQHIPPQLEGEINNIIQGIIMTKNELERAFAKHGLELIEPQEGDDFNYNNHHAIAQVMTDKHKTGTIVGTMQAGYKIKDRLIRPASVTVSKKAETPDEQENKLDE